MNWWKGQTNQMSKSSEGGWEVGPRGGRRRKAPGGGWEYEATPAIRPTGPPPKKETREEFEHKTKMARTFTDDPAKFRQWQESNPTAKRSDFARWTDEHVKEGRTWEEAKQTLKPAPKEALPTVEGDTEHHKAANSLLHTKDKWGRWDKVAEMKKDALEGVKGVLQGGDHPHIKTVLGEVESELKRRK